MTVINCLEQCLIARAKIYFFLDNFNSIETWSGESEFSSTIVNKIEFNISSSADLLPILFLFSKGRVHSSLNYGKVAFANRTSTRHLMAEAGFVVWFSIFVFCEMTSDVIKEDATNASAFSTENKSWSGAAKHLLRSAMSIHKILVAPLFESVVDSRPAPITSNLLCAMKVLDIFFVDVSRGEISSTAKPGFDSISSFNLKVSIVVMDCWAVRINWVCNAWNSEDLFKNNQRI